jgi:exopolysaccharide biosynthesis predicted pyruvyltransferase EpsI
MLQTSVEVVGRLRNELSRTLYPLVDGRPGYALVDFPYHSNVGDSAIWLGEISILERMFGSKPSYVCSQTFDWRALDDLPGDFTIFIHGGGNFGDIWPAHQRFREALISRFPDRDVVQLPQTIYFDDLANISNIARAIEYHRHFTLLVRDRASYDLGSRHLNCKIVLCPDLAFELGPFAGLPEPSRDLLLMLRDDRETAGYLKKAKEVLAAPSDWLVEPSSTMLRGRIYGLLSGLKNGAIFDSASRKGEYYNSLASVRLQRGILQLAGSRKIISDRLHVHILSTILNIPHVVLDNRYGKITGMIETWNSAWSGVDVSTSLKDAVEIINKR